VIFTDDFTLQLMIRGFNSAEGASRDWEDHTALVKEENPVTHFWFYLFKANGIFSGTISNNVCLVYYGND
jgi:hypothetical protein